MLGALAEIFMTPTNDFGNFTYSDEGFEIVLESSREKVRWTSIERIIAYKVDLFTTDLICLDIECNGRKLTISEEVPGWFQFIKKVSSTLSGIPKNWELQVANPTFHANCTTIYLK